MARRSEVSSKDCSTWNRKSRMKVTKICSIGAGYVGGPTMAKIAQMCPDIEVQVVDINAERIAAWQTDDLPIYEPGLLEVVQEARGRNLFFSTDVETHVADADMIFVSVNTPTKTYGEGAGFAANLQYVEQCARDIGRYARGAHKIVVEKSTLPVKTAQALKRILDSAPTRTEFQILSNPEFLAEGTAMADLADPDRVLIGGEESAEGAEAIQSLVDIYARWIPEDRIITSNVWSSELSKLTANAFLAQRISSINSISALCERTGANVDEVARAIGADTRVGSKFLKASVGFGGSCFQKDILNLVYIAQSEGLPEVAEYWHQVVRMNDYQKRRFVRQMVRTMFNTVAGKHIAIWGFAFKKDTNDTRESAAIYVCRDLLQERARLRIHDPRVDPDHAMHDLRAVGAFDGIDESHVSFSETAEAAADGAHAIAVITEWDQFRAADFARIHAAMERPAFVFDGRNLLDAELLRSQGFEYYGVGIGEM